VPWVTVADDGVAPSVKSGCWVEPAVKPPSPFGEPSPVGPSYPTTAVQRLLPAHEPFLKHVDFAAGIVTLDLPAGFEDL